MSINLSWRDALKQFNDNRTKEGGKYTIPKKGTPEYAQVRAIMGEKLTDAVPLQPNQTVTGQTKPRAKKPTDSEEKIHKAVQALVPNEPKPVEKKAKKNGVIQELKPDSKDKKSKKKSVTIQTDPPPSPKSDDFKLKLN